MEAQYDRAICLLKLGRYEEASQALTPFAAGIYGKYRQRESKALLRALDRKLQP